MRWYIYSEQTATQQIEFFTSAAQLALELIPPCMCFLHQLIGKIQTTDVAAEADYFLVPALVNLPYGPLPTALDADLHRYLFSLPHFAVAPERHVIFLLGDNHEVPAVCRESLVFMPSCRKSSRVFPMHYFADPPASPLMPIEQCDFQASFQGALTGFGLRHRLVQALRDRPRADVKHRVTDGYFYLAYDVQQQGRLRAEFIDLLARSRFIFCPRGDGLTSMRFYETIAYGRLPILIADETGLPLEQVIPYEQFVVRVPEKEVEHWDEYLDAFLMAHPDLNVCSSVAQNTYRHWFTLETAARMVEESILQGDLRPEISSGRARLF